MLQLGDPGDVPGRLHVATEEQFTQADLDEQRRQQQLQQAALRAVRAAKAREQQSRRKRKKSAQPKGAGKRARKTKDRDFDKEVAADAPAVSGAETDSETMPCLDSASEDDSSDGWLEPADEQQASRVVPAAAGAGPLLEERVGSGAAVVPAEMESASSAGEAARAPSLEPQPVPNAPRRGGSRAGRSWQRRGQGWGPFLLSPIVRTSDGRVTGYGAICGLHRDSGPDSCQGQCKKAAALSLRQGGPSEAELRTRLKRWLLAGMLDTEDWPSERMRSRHVALQLTELAEGPSEQEMDAWMESFLRRTRACV